LPAGLARHIGAAPTGSPAEDGPVPSPSATTRTSATSPGSGR